MVTCTAETARQRLMLGTQLTKAGMVACSHCRCCAPRQCAWMVAAAASRRAWRAWSSSRGKPLISLFSCSRACRPNHKTVALRMNASCAVRCCWRRKRGHDKAQAHLDALRVPHHDSLEPGSALLLLLIFGCLQKAVGEQLASCGFCISLQQHQQRLSWAAGTAKRTCRRARKRPTWSCIVEEAPCCVLNSLRAQSPLVCACVRQNQQQRAASAATELMLHCSWGAAFSHLIPGSLLQLVLLAPLQSCPRTG